MASTAREQLVDFLAHLDLQTKGPKSWSLQDNNVEEHIQKTLENISEQLSHRYAVEHIRDRLWQEFRISYAYPENNFPALFLHGSYEMKSLDNATRVLVGNRAHEICLQQSFGNDRSRRSRSIVAETAQTTSSSRPRTSSHVSPLQSLKRKKKPRNSKQKRLRATEPARVKVWLGSLISKVRPDLEIGWNLYQIECSKTTDTDHHHSIGSKERAWTSS